jgi:hypothetical protein
MPEKNGHYENVYIHQNFNRNEIREFLLENAQYNTRPNVSTGQDKGLMYFDTEINRIIVWNGAEWKIVRYFDDRDLSNTEDVNLQDIWGESTIVASLTEDEAKGLTGASQSVVEYIEDLPLIHLPGSWSYFNNQMKAVVFPKSFDGISASYSPFYEPVVKNSKGEVVDPQYYTINQYEISGNIQYRIEFLDGKQMRVLCVSPDQLPTISYYKYIGERLSLNIISGIVDKYKFLGSAFSIDPNNSDRYRRNLTGTGVSSINQISSLTINGQQINANTHYYVYEENGINYLSIDIDELGWKNDGGWDSDDVIYLNVMDSI